MSIFKFTFAAAALSAFVNFLFRKSTDPSTETSNCNYYLLFLYFTSLVISFMISPLDTLSQFNPTMFTIGCVVGVLNMTMMWLTSQALVNGPTGSTFAFQNASGVFPGLILFMVFGPVFGFEISFLQVIGITMVLWGLYIGANGGNSKISRRWLMYALGCFLVQILAFCVIYWRCLLFNSEIPSHYLIPWKLSSNSDAWFLPGQFGTAFLLQLIVVFTQEKGGFSFRNLFYGSSAGILNAISSFLLLLATKFALPFEKGLIFPSFVVMTMVFCNAWANRLYNERFNWISNCLCSFGIFLGVSF